METNNKHTGASLIEVMVALFVLAIGILGVLAMQSKSMQFSQTSYSYTQAVYLANDIAERIRGNLGASNSYITDGMNIPAFDASVCGSGAGCAPAVRAARDLSAWIGDIQTSLPSGQGSIATFTLPAAGNIPARDYLEISVSFDDSRAELDDLKNGNLADVRTFYKMTVEI